MEEEFKYIPGYGMNYMINKNGIIISYLGKKPKILKHIISQGGYKMVALYAPDKRKNVFRTVASVLLETFGSNKPSSKFKCTYIDNNKDNLTLSNLKWATKEEICKKMTIVRDARRRLEFTRS